MAPTTPITTGPYPVKFTPKNTETNYVQGTINNFGDVEPEEE